MPYLCSRNLQWIYFFSFRVKHELITLYITWWPHYQSNLHPFQSLLGHYTTPSLLGTHQTCCFLCLEFSSPDSQVAHVSGNRLPMSNVSAQVLLDFRGLPWTLFLLPSPCFILQCKNFLPPIIYIYVYLFLSCCLSFTLLSEYSSFITRNFVLFIAVS